MSGGLDSRTLTRAFVEPADAVAFLETILQASTEYSVVGKDLDGTIVLWNSGARRLYGYDAEEIVDKCTSDVLHTPEDLAAGMPEAMRRGALADGKWEGVVTLVRRDGSRFPARVVLTPRHDARGTPIGFVLISNDVSDRKQVEEALRASEKQFRGLLESAPDAMVIVDADGRIALVNRQTEQLFGYQREELLGRPVELLIPERFRGDHSQHRHGYMATPRMRPMGAGLQLYGRRRDGSEFPAEISLGPMVTDQGTLVSATVRSITDRRQAEVALQQAKRAAEQASGAKSEYLSRMSHELRTPLNAILGFAQLLELDDLRQDQRDNLHHILAGAKHLLGLINEVLDIAAVEAGRLPLSLEPVAIAEVVAETVSLMRPLADQHAIVLEAPKQACEGHVLGDRQRLKQILLNLLSNAVKYNRPGGSVRLGCERVPVARVRISVSDTGPGIAPEMVESLYVPFERLGSEHTTVEGTGLGLPLSKRLAEAMGGSLEMVTTVKRGSTFWVELPLTEDPVEIAERTGTFERLGRSVSVEEQRQLEHPPLTVLYIEDNLSNLQLVERILSRRPWANLISAMRPQLGLELAAEHHPDLVLLDLHLPDMPGEEVLRRLRSEPRTADVPVVVLSADARPNRISQLLEAGARKFLTKPLEVKKLLDLLDTVAAERRQAAPPPRW